jgi:hypothetical protein
MFTACKPPCMSLCIGQQHSDDIIDQWVIDVTEEIAFLKANPGTISFGSGFSFV